MDVNTPSFTSTPDTTWTGAKYSILDTGPEGPRKVQYYPAKGNVNSNLIISIVAAIILLAFFFWLAYATSVGIFQDQVAKSQIGYLCSPGNCAVDTTTGEKFCPSDPTAKQPYNPHTQVCSEKFSCSDNTYRYASQIDGSTDQFGNCEPGIPCRCLGQAHCPRYIASIFQTVNGNPYISGGVASGSLAEFNQVQANVGQGSIDGPNLRSNSNSFCAIPRSWLFRSTPGCGTVPLSLLPADSTKSCFLSNPCLYGTVAFVTDNSDAFTLADLDRLAVSCVAADPCPNDPSSSNFNVPIYDTKFGGLVCKNFDI